MLRTDSSKAFDERARLVLFRASEIAVEGESCFLDAHEGLEAYLPRAARFDDPELGPLAALELEPDEGLPPGLAAKDFRAALLGRAQPEYRALSRARMLAAHPRDFAFCPVCGERTRAGSGVAVCASCGREHWTRYSPASIVLCHRGDEVLLAHNRRFREGLFSLVAGFVDAGETLEEAALRELREEAGVVAKEPRYAMSQAWPFPCSLMAGFYAEWVSGEPVPDMVEVSECRFFRADSLPEIPSPGTVAHKLIARWKAALEGGALIG